MSSEDAVQFSYIGSDARNRGRNKRIFIQPLANVFGSGTVRREEESDTAPTSTTTSDTAISNRSDPIISRLESQIEALSIKVEQLSSQINSAQPQPKLQLDGGRWSTHHFKIPSYPRGPTQQRVNFAKEFESAPKVLVSMFYADLDCKKNFRVNAYATDIDSKGFTIHVAPWHDTMIYDIGLSWVAIGNDKK